MADSLSSAADDRSLTYVVRVERALGAPWIRRLCGDYVDLILTPTDLYASTRAHSNRFLARITRAYDFRANKFSAGLDLTSIREEEDGSDVHGDIRVERVRPSFGIYSDKSLLSANNSRVCERTLRSAHFDTPHC